MKLKTITIDFWNTIFDSSNGVERNAHRQSVIFQNAESLGAVIQVNEFEKAMKSSWENFNTIWKNELRTPTTLEIVEYFWDCLHLPYDSDTIEKVKKSFEESILLYPPKLMDGVKEALEVLERKYCLAIVSDTGFSPGSILKVLLNQESILHFFSAFSFSDETGVSKPHPKAYMTVLDRLKCEPFEALHIGDIEQTDISGAKRIGMNAIRFSGDPTARFNLDNPKHTKADFEAYSWKEIVDYILKT